MNFPLLRVSRYQLSQSFILLIVITWVEDEFRLVNKELREEVVKLNIIHSTSLFNPTSIA